MHVDLIRAYTLGILRARLEYREHPFANAGCKPDHGCLWRRMRAAQRAERVRSGARGQSESERASTGRISERGDDK